MRNMRNLVRFCGLIAFYVTPFGWMYLVGAVYMAILDYITLPQDGTQCGGFRAEEVGAFTSVFKVFR